VLSAELKAFYMVARLGSITLAAKKLGLSQPTVTTQIRNLESQYSVELFYRGGRRLSVSDEGARLLPMVKVLLQQEADIEFFLRNSGQVQGTLRIAATAPYYILDLVKTFRERLPQVEVSVEIGNSQQVLEALEDYRVDVAASSQLLDDARLIRRVLGSDSQSSAGGSRPCAARCVGRAYVIDARVGLDHSTPDRGIAGRRRGEFRAAAGDWQPGVDP
jgi:DNA-binding transcriptional LysR family regulator